MVYELHISFVGKDGTESFEDVGHSPDAREMQESYRIGRVSKPASTRVKVSFLVDINSSVTLFVHIQKKTSPDVKDIEQGNSWFWPAFALVLLVIAASYFYQNFAN